MNYENLGASFEAILKIPTMYDSYKARAKASKLDFTIPFRAFDHLVKEPCHYCKIKKPLDIAGIDRLDNTQGYVSGNCVPSCWDCNRSKSDKTLAQFNEYLKRFNNELTLSETPNTLHWEKK